MPTLGEELKRRREERDITLGDISESTRIGTRFLKAIEADNYSILPGGIFTRSFIRAFAKQVGMDEDEAITIYNQQIGVPPATAQSTESTTPTEDRPRRSEPIIYHSGPTRTNWSTLVIAAGILLFIVLIVFALVKQLNQSSQSSQEAAAPAAQPSPASTGQPSAQADTSPPPATEEPSPPDVAGEPLTVKIESAADASENSSIQYWIDDAPKSTAILLRPGESHALPAAQNQVRLTIGNRLPLKLKINDREARFPPEVSKFGARVLISRDNLQTFFQ